MKGRNGEENVENRLGDTVGEREGAMNVYTIMCKIDSKGEIAV